MSRSNSGWAAAALIAATLGTAEQGCSSADQSPLGGPYGGTAVPPPAVEGNGGSTSGGQGAASAPADAGPSSAAQSGSGSDGGSGSSSGGGTSSGGSSGASSGGTSAPTWTQVFTAYMAPGTEGNCANCHGQMGSASGAYSWLQSKGYLGGSSPALTTPSSSCLSWYGGNMPPNGPSDPKAVAAMNAWAAAGAKNN